MVSSALAFALFLAACGLIVLPIFLKARAQAGTSSTARARLIAQGAAGVAIGLFAALWLPTRVRDTQGSPASLVIMVLLWIIGGGLALLSTARLLGALFAKPATERTW